tara:strand:- start:1305 stop:1886 length:582 start_codon:yes stop_codon:yes gene_type:complete
MADKNLNPMEQKVYDVSDQDNPLNYNQMLNQVSETYGQTPASMKDIMGRIAFHETGPGSRMNPETIQSGGGPGRGLFQFETGEHQGGMTAMRRLRQYYANMGSEPPEWTEFNPREGVDAAALSPKQQEMMFLANTLMGKGRSFAGVTPENVGEWWQKYHYAGPEDKRGLFNESMAAYDLKYAPTTEEKAFGKY